MSFFDRIFDRLEDFLFWVATSIMTGIAMGSLWFVRVVLTNKKQIEILRAELRHRDQLRMEDREIIAEIKGSVRTIQEILMENHDADK